MTLDDVYTFLAAAIERDRETLIGRISAILRGLSKDPWKGLDINRGRLERPSRARIMREWFWREGED